MNLFTFWTNEQARTPTLHTPPTPPHWPSCLPAPSGRAGVPSPSVTRALGALTRAGIAVGGWLDQRKLTATLTGREGADHVPVGWNDPPWYCSACCTTSSAHTYRGTRPARRVCRTVSTLGALTVLRCDRLLWSVLRVPTGTPLSKGGVPFRLG